MYHKLTPIVLALIAAAALPAQTAAFNSFGSACPNTQNTLKISGLPKLGSTFTVTGIRFPGACTRKFCVCTCCDCNDCSGSVLFLGVSKRTLQISPQCLFLISPDVLLLGNASGNIPLTVPNDSKLLGVKFYMQRLDLGLKEVTGSQCPTTYRPTSFVGVSEGVEGIAGR
jgi:hypothetical protein